MNSIRRVMAMFGITDPKQVTENMLESTKRDDERNLCAQWRAYNISKVKYGDGTKGRRIYKKVSHV